MTTHAPPLLTLAQDGSAPPLPTDGTEAVSGAAGTTGQPTGRAPGGPFGGDLLLVMLVVVAGFILFSIMGQRREKKKRDAMLSAIRKHDRVQTIGGVIGHVIEVKTQQVVLKVDESSNTRITFARSAIQQVLPGESRAVSTSGAATEDASV